MDARPGNSKKETVTTVCGICPGACGVKVTLIDGKIEKILPLKDHPVGVMCVRGVHAKEIIYSPDRLRQPLLRVGERGEGKFQPISWDEALDRTAEAFKKVKDEYGAEAIMAYFGRGSFDPSLTDVFGAKRVQLQGVSGFLFPFGSPNTAGVSALCYTSYAVFAARTTLGTEMALTYPDYDNSDLVVIWGANPPTDSPPDSVKKILDAKRRGAPVIVIDHMRSDMAKKASQWIGVRSGTDGALALSMLHVVINQELYDKEFVKEYTVGFDELKEYVRQFPPEVAEKITRVPRETIVETARAIARAKGASLSMYTGLEYTNSGVQNIRAVMILWAITGHLDTPGGLVFRNRVPGRFHRVNLEAPEGVKPIGADRYPLFCDWTKTAQFLDAPRAILHDDPYPARALLVYGASLLTGLPNPDLWKECFKKLDFMAVFDRFLTADAMYADIVFPGTTDYEMLSYQKYLSGFCQLRQRVIPPLNDSRPGFLFLAELAKRLGFGDMVPCTEEERLAYVFEGSPVSVDQLKAHPEGVRYYDQPQEYLKYAKGMMRKGGVPGFNTPSGKIEIVSSILQKYGYDGLPVYVEPTEGPLGSPELYKDYPLVLNTGARTNSAFRSQHLNIPGLLKMRPKPLALINPEDAAVRGIADGDKVWVVSPRGKVGVWARVTDDVMAGEVEVDVGGGGPIQAPEWREANANYLTDLDNRDPISGFPVYKALLCEVRKREGLSPG